MRFLARAHLLRRQTNLLVPSLTKSRFRHHPVRTDIEYCLANHASEHPDHRRRLVAPKCLPRIAGFALGLVLAFRKRLGSPKRMNRRTRKMYEPAGSTPFLRYLRQQIQADRPFRLSRWPIHRLLDFQRESGASDVSSIPLWRTCLSVWAD